MKTVWASDSGFLRGDAHDVCQDYAAVIPAEVCGVVGGVISDGCSSSPSTDIGARLLGYGAAVLSPDGDGWLRTDAVLDRAFAAAAALELRAPSLDATLGSVASQCGVLTAELQGDGVIAVQLTDGELLGWHITYGRSAPWYPAYARQQERRSVWEAEIRDTCQATSLFETPQPAGIEVYSDGRAHRVRLPASMACAMLVATDGAADVREEVLTETSRQTRRVPLARVVSQLFAVRVVCGDFVTRRLRRLLGARRHCCTVAKPTSTSRSAQPRSRSAQSVCNRADKWSLGDDLAVAMVVSRTEEES